ncbi:tetratricopeptide repeat protein [Turicibacter sanguinis]|uniref:tetratricopeptide repeat protein n=1 Tax=Turicibacter sanguinis TaxID=154288 RepID=UPI00189B252D|nr:hypothetical protein [Turicibacter sanguinis]
MLSFLKKLFLDRKESVISKKNDITFTSNNDDFEPYKKFNAKIERGWNLNEKGIEYERVGDIDNAIVCYEANITNGFDGSHPYKRLAIIYRKKKDYINEIRVLEKAIESYHCNKAYNVKTYEEFKVRLIKAKLLRDKSC